MIEFIPTSLIWKQEDHTDSHVMCGNPTIIFTSPLTRESFVWKLMSTLLHLFYFYIKTVFV
uniref:Putative ovule protein n=1 Tax=Solanum chacoense TaxID=4108 RepID=A0A0V0HIN4_SOLCH